MASASAIRARIEAIIFSLIADPCRRLETVRTRWAISWCTLMIFGTPYCFDPDGFVLIPWGGVPPSDGLNVFVGRMFHSGVRPVIKKRTKEDVCVSFDSMALNLCKFFHDIFLGKRIVEEFEEAVGLR